MSNLRYTIKELEALSTEDLIAELVYLEIKMSHSPTKVQLDYEKKVVKVLSERLDLDGDKLLKVLDI